MKRRSSVRTAHLCTACLPLSRNNSSAIGIAAAIVAFCVAKILPLTQRSSSPQIATAANVSERAGGGHRPLVNQFVMSEKIVIVIVFASLRQAPTRAIHLRRVFFHVVTSLATSSSVSAFCAIARLSGAAFPCQAHRD